MKISKIVIGDGPADTHLYDQDGKELENIMAFTLHASINDPLITCDLEVLVQQTEIELQTHLEANEKVALYRIGSEFPQKFIKGEEK